jgi:hypothetical protein
MQDVTLPQRCHGLLGKRYEHQQFGPRH